MENKPNKIEVKPRIKTGFKANSNPVIIPITCVQNPAVVSTFTHNAENVKTFTDSVIAQGHTLEQQKNHNPEDFEDYAEKVKRMISLAMAKKLACSLEPMDNGAYSSLLAPIKSASVRVPAPIVPFIDQFGFIEGPNGNFSMRCQHFWAFNYFMHAISTTQVSFGGRSHAYRENGYFVNTRWTQRAGYIALGEVCKSEINSWVDSGVTFSLEFANYQTTLKVPRFERGFHGYSAMVAAVEKPASVMRALAIGSLLEELHDQEYNFIPEIVDAFAAQSVYFVDLDKDKVTERLAWYTFNVSTRLQVSLGSGNQWVELDSLKAHGGYGQLIRRDGDRTYTSPVPVTGSEAHYGVIS